MAAKPYGKVRCVVCHWQGSVSELILYLGPSIELDRRGCPSCRSMGDGYGEPAIVAAAVAVDCERVINQGDRPAVIREEIVRLLQRPGTTESRLFQEMLRRGFRGMEIAQELGVMIKGLIVREVSTSYGTLLDLHPNLQRPVR